MYNYNLGWKNRQHMFQFLDNPVVSTFWLCGWQFWANGWKTLYHTQRQTNPIYASWLELEFKIALKYDILSSEFHISGHSTFLVLLLWPLNCNCPDIALDWIDLHKEGRGRAEHFSHLNTLELWTIQASSHFGIHSCSVLPILFSCKTFKVTNAVWVT